MKKVLSIAAAVVMVAGLASCKKDRTCECTWDGDVIYTETQKLSKKDAEEWCEGSQTSSGGGTIECKLK